MQDLRVGDVDADLPYASTVIIFTSVVISLREADETVADETRYGQPFVSTPKDF